MIVDFMRKHGFDALAFMGADWIEWAANQPIGELAWERPALLVITADGRRFLFVSEQSRYHIAQAQAQGTIWADRFTFFSEWPGTDRPWLWNQWPEMVANVLAAEGLGTAHIGFDAVHGAMAAAAKLLPRLKTTAVGESLRSLRWIKHSDEIAVMREAASLSDWAIERYREEIRPGRLIDELDFSVSAQLAQEGARRVPGEHYTIVRLFTASGEVAAAVKGDIAPTGRLVEPDSMAISTLTTRLNGMAMELARPFLTGRSDRFGRLLDAARAAQEAAIEAAVVGQPVKAMHAAAQRVAQQAINREGLDDFLHVRVGHAIGVTQHDFPENTPFNERLIMENEVYSLEPGLYLRGIGAFRFSDAIVIRAGGTDRLTQSRKDRDWLTLPN